tara:strand:+ start:226 stop:1431 length:1206 start_codon:yes stop_codon:yes gene_type:complete
MPLNNPAPNFALLASFDMRGQSAQTVFTRNSNPVNLPTYASDSGVFEDVIFFLNGRISSATVNATSNTDNAKTFGTGWAVSINSSDKVQISASAEFTVTHTGTTDALGFGSSTVNSVQVGSNYIATAPNDWLRGVVILDNLTYRIDEVGGGSSTFNTPAVTSDVQDVSVWLRSSSTSDVDSFGLTSLQALDNTATGTATDITWLINDDGFTQCYYRSSLGDITWNNTAIRDALGFRGDESPVVDGTIKRLTATYKPHSLLLPSRPYQGHHLRAENVSQSRRKIGGGYVSNYIGTYITSVLRFDLDALLDSQDDYRHFTDKFLAQCSEGERINFYQAWGDSRRSLITANVNAEQPAYNELYTSEDNGELGRIRGTLITAQFDLSYPSRLKRRVPVNLEIEHL